MSSPYALSPHTVASQLAAALDAYDSDTAAMITAWPDLERYRAFSARVEQIRLYCAAIPDARLQWVELLVAHAELVHLLWRTQYGNQHAALTELAGVREHHAQCIRALRERCLRRIPQPPQGGAPALS